MDMNLAPSSSGLRPIPFTDVTLVRIQLVSFVIRRLVIGLKVSLPKSRMG